MKAAYTLLHLENKGLNAEQVFALDVLDGLSAYPKNIPSRYLYDKLGSQLFQKITELDEYYQFHCELEILKEFRSQISKVVGSSSLRLIELGVGDVRKPQILLQHLLERSIKIEYIPIDYNPEVVSNVIESLKQKFSGYPLRVSGLVADYFSALSCLEKKSTQLNIVLFLGSSIGNLNENETKHLLYHIWASLNQGDFMLIGFDLKKDFSIMERAYNDSKGVTKAFNINLLNRMNSELLAHFDVSKFIHYCFYNPREGRMESWVVSKIPQTVLIEKLQKEFHFDGWEGIHVENSYKYSLASIKNLALKTGFSVKQKMTDKRGYFVAEFWQVNKM